MTDQVHVGVEVCGLIVQDVHIFLSEDEAEKWFKEYTGLEYGTLYDEQGECVDDEYDQTKIFTLMSDTGLSTDGYQTDVKVRLISSAIRSPLSQTAHTVVNRESPQGQ
jgi:hypothetical protein